MSISLFSQHQKSSQPSSATSAPKSPFPKILAQWSTSALQVLKRIMFAARRPLRQNFCDFGAVVGEVFGLHSVERLTQRA
jgi:hypothetical protein